MRLRGILLILLGLVMVLPYWIIVFWAEYSSHYMSPLLILSIFGMLLGGPILLIGIIMIFVPRYDQRVIHNSNDIELSRIRYVAEMTARKENK